VATRDGWPSTIYGCKKGGKNRSVDEDKRWDSKEKEVGRQAEGGQFLVVREELAR
jgi:hypothetical protein